MKELYEVLMPVIEHPVVPLDRTALVVIDMQYLDAHPDHGFGRRLAEAGRAHLAEPFFARLRDVAIPQQRALVQAARAARVPVVFVRICASAGGVEANRQYRMWGIVPTPDQKEAQILEELGPEPGDSVVNKVATSAFNGSDLDQVLRNRGVERIIVCGVNTNNCVELTSRDAADRGYWVDVVEDACAALAGDQAHEEALRRLNFGLSRVRAAKQVLAELGGER